MKAEECPNATAPTHRTGPAGYLARADWAENMLKTHTQSQCTTCGLWVVWTPKP
jgi:hypothetical protein